MQFEDLKVWNLSRGLYMDLDSILDDHSISKFFKDQILRATLSISNNIAEGFERETKKELIRFFYIAKGSCGEVRSMLYIALDKNYINKDDFETLSGKCKHISIMLYKYINSISQ